MRSRIENRFINHQNLVKFINQLGYKTDWGLCHGYALAFICAALLKETKQFTKRLQLMQVLWRDFATQSNISFPAFVRSYDRDNDIPAFCEALLVHGEPERYAEWFEQGSEPKLPMPQLTLPLMQPSKLGKVYLSPLVTGAYTKADLSIFFGVMRYVLNAQQLSTALLLGSLYHALVVYYDHEKQTWIFADLITNPPRTCRSIPDVVNQVYDFFAPHAVVISTQLFALDEAKLKEAFTQLTADVDWRELHQVNDINVNLLGYETADWFQVAVQNGDLVVLENLLAVVDHKNILFNQVNQSDQRPLDIAVEANQTAVVRFLAENGYFESVDHNSNETLIKIAINNENREIICLLMSNGVAMTYSDFYIYGVDRGSEFYKWLNLYWAIQTKSISYSLRHPNQKTVFISLIKFTLDHSLQESSDALGYLTKILVLNTTCSVYTPVTGQQKKRLDNILSKIEAALTSYIKDPQDERPFAQLEVQFGRLENPRSELTRHSLFYKRNATDEEEVTTKNKRKRI